MLQSAIVFFAAGAREISGILCARRVCMELVGIARPNLHARGARKAERELGAGRQFLALLLPKYPIWI